MAVKKWFGWLSGADKLKGVSSQDIEAEINALKSDQADLIALKLSLESRLENSRVSELGGKKSTVEIATLESDLGFAIKKIDTISTVISQLENKLVDALATEREEQRKQIKAELAEVESEIAAEKKRFISLLGAAVASWLKFGGSIDGFSAGPNKLPVVDATTPERVNEFRSIFNDIVKPDGQIPRSLLSDRNDLLKQLKG
ncbi:hypothetical protein MTBBW1_2620015 [Desulfamplus magnetovallimortis]|uniref:Uncharacterized protein n=1 Tax=Desulfamplus magnetovallimortis TaxID=1246637 RepID=A0A1W1HEW9_9BACT|nr:hypothetical protein [Desulfamplus magnetovallimortis]SLM31051.1 hypothetical protein MTBBW1_2620015 [Desulfamplus magnetovallimortis]